jgi:predicted dehydrogenase
MIGATGIAIAGTGFSAKSYAAIVGANERLGVAVIGVRNQGTVHRASWCMLKDSHNVQVSAICDTDEALFAPALKLVEAKSGVKPAANWDLRVILDDKAIDAVSIAVPNHWHALAAIWASQAGKHVYVVTSISIPLSPASPGALAANNSKAAPKEGLAFAP